jgi:hypothetical protein
VYKASTKELLFRCESSFFRSLSRGVLRFVSPCVTPWCVTFFLLFILCQEASNLAPPLSHVSSKTSNMIFFSFFGLSHIGLFVVLFNSPPFPIKILFVILSQVIKISISFTQMTNLMNKKQNKN